MGTSQRQSAMSCLDAFIKGTNTKGLLRRGKVMQTRIVVIPAMAQEKNNFLTLAASQPSLVLGTISTIPMAKHG